MNIVRRTLIKIFVVIACITTIIPSVFATTDPPVVTVLRGDNGQLKKDSFRTTADIKYFTDPANLNYDSTTCKYANIITLMLNEESSYFISSNFTVTLPIHIQYTSAFDKSNGQFVEHGLDTSLTLTYRKDSGTFIARRFILDSGYRKVVVTIRDSLHKDVDWDVSQVLRLENEMRVVRNYKFTCGISPVLNTAAFPQIAGIDQKDELKIGWTDPNVGQTGYDLEWAWVDESALEQYKEGNQYSERLFFMNNASRVTLGAEKLTYNIPLIYDGIGRIFYRVRPVQDQDDGSRLEGKWTIVVESNGSLSNNFAFAGHENNLNWQVTTSYAEEGKRKTVIQYFDGTLRSRQTVTKDNTTGTTVVAETMYDFQGRPAIQVLPAPTLNTIIAFSKNFNIGLNGNGSYPKDLYDGIGASDILCLKPADQMVGGGTNNNSASNYYSPNNPLHGQGMNQYIPDAGNYPFTETRYTPDATGRIAAQSGVGPDHILGSGHETRYYYGQADPEDLDPLFGTDVGYASHYFKNMVRDANGQYSVSYVDMHGRTVATALAGENPANLKPLLSMAPRASVIKKLLDKETNIIKGRSIESIKELLVPKEGSYLFQYSLNPETLSLLDKNNASVCYSCMYDLEIEISDDCGNCNLPNKQPIYLRRSKFSLATLDSDCMRQPAGLAINQAITLKEGSYTVRKTLTLSQQAQDKYRDGLYTRRNTVKTFNSIYNETLTAMLDGYVCAIGLDCAACTTRVGSLPVFTQRYLDQAHIATLSAEQTQEITEAWNQAIASCSVLCNEGTNRVEGLRGAMLQDMMPDLGQYAISANNTNAYNIFNSSILQPNVSSWRHPRNEQTDAEQCYTSTSGQCVSVTSVTNNEVTSFIGEFQATWAKNLLYYHPEYYRLKLAEDPNQLAPSYTFDNQIQNTKTWADALPYIYSYPSGDITDHDPFFTRNPAGKSTMRDKVNINNQFAYSMWQLAYAAVVCRSKPVNNRQSCIANAPKTADAINSASGLCTADRDMIWNVFRQIYLYEKEKMVYAWSTGIIPSVYGATPPPTAATLTGLGYTPRFIDPANLAAYPGGPISTAATSTDATIQQDNATALLNAHYNENCTALSINWLSRLQVFKDCNSTITDAMLNGLVTQLKNICVGGSDVNHPMGSSSVNPSNTTVSPRTFEEAIANFLRLHNMPYTATCNPYILSDMDPQLYTAQQGFSNPEIIIKPDSCQCAQIATVKATFLQSGFSGTFSAYLGQFHGTVISQGALDTLQNLCNGTYTCAVLPSPISLPPALQCGASSQTCIGCETFNMYRDSFRIRFGASWPVANHPDTAFLPLDSAFAAFVNYKTGFNKSIYEYLAFADTCGHVSVTDTCRRLDSIAHAFVTTYDRTHRMYSATTGCDTAHWVSNYGDGSLQVISLSDIMVNGEYKPKFRDSLTYPSSLDYGDNVCFDSMTFEARIKLPRTGYGYNPYAPGYYSFELAWYFDDNPQRKADFAFDLGEGFIDLHYLREPSGVQVLRLNNNFDDYRILKVVIGQSQYHLYIDGIHIADFPHQPYQRFRYFYFQPYAYSFRADWIKLYDKNGQVIMDEEFNHDCGNMAFITREPCRPADCQTAFAEYYNQLSGTNLTYSQLETISQQQCGKALNVCSSAPSDTCSTIKYLVDDYKKQMGRSDTMYPVQIRTLTGAPTPEEGPKGVFDINGNLIGNTIETGTTLAIKQSFVQIWNSSTVNQQTGTLSVDNFGRMFLKLNSGKPYPCKGITGLRYYQFDTETDHINAIRSGVGTYVDFGDGNRINATQTYSGTTTQVYFKETGTELGNYNGGVFYQSVLGTWYILHQYATPTLHTITVYHSDTLGHVGLDCYDCGRYGAVDYNLTDVKNLRGYIPRQTIQWYWAGTRNLTFNRTSQIKNLGEATNVRIIGHTSSNIYGTYVSVEQHQDNFFAYNRWDSFPASTNLRYLQLDYRGEWDNATVPVSNYLPNWTINYPNIEFVAARNFKGHAGGKMVSWALPHISKIVLYFHDYNANEIDTLLMQVAAATDRCGGEIELYNSLTDRTSASDAAIASLQAKGWTIKFSYYNNGGTYNPTATCTETYNSPTPFTFPNTNLPYTSPFTEWLAQRSSYNISPKYAEELVNRCGTLNLCGESTPVTGPLLCGLNAPKFSNIINPKDTCGYDLPDLAFNKATEYYAYYLDSLRNVFDTAYYNKCMKAKELENFTVTHDVYEYHYTLYYYDQAGNLVQTVPPEGVHPDYTVGFSQSLANARATENSLPVRPPHTLVTKYRYNTLNQVVEQETPDARVSNFWYDLLGRLVVSQNAKQASTTISSYSYTLYDDIGRITEVGQKPLPAGAVAMTPELSRRKEDLASWLNAGNNREEITQTIYDEAYPGFLNLTIVPPLVQYNLRNRVSYVRLFDTQADMTIAAGHKAATYYTYDIHGNVDELLQDINQGVMKPATGANRFKKIHYTYDLISGKVNYVAYQQGWKDQFFHKYAYDAENRITEVWTSPDEVYWERDAHYQYYKHGPLARTVLGQLQVQGVDYAYTIQGWLKGVNGTASPTKPEIAVAGVQDMGGDGDNTNYVAKDILGFSLNYYKYTDNNNIVHEDYTAINALSASTRVKPFAEMPVLHTAGMPNPGNGSPLYNGNINAMMVNLPKVGEPILYSYTYDQLNRIVAMDAYNGFIPSSNTWNVISTLNYKERVSYDANGNILTYLRNGNTSGNKPQDMDNLTYQYERNMAGNIISNKLRYVHDQVDAGNYATDIDNETTLSLANVGLDNSESIASDNYQYDPIGNLVKDAGNKITAITWTVYGKIKTITKTNGTVINYTYDAAGNRITKTVSTAATGSIAGTSKVTVYVRDAQGNVMSIYTKQNGNNLKQSEVDLYGSSRLGIWKPDRDVQMLTPANNSMATFTRGAKQYELSNHLGNVMATITDNRVAIPIAGTTTIHHYEAVIASANDYYPFGMQLPGRNQSDGTAGTPGNPTGRIRIEAENFNDGLSSGIVKEACGDLGGTLDVGYIDAGDALTYDIMTPISGAYVINFRVSNDGSPSSFQVRSSNGTVLATINIPRTGGWQNYITLSATITLPAGQQTLQLLCTSNNWNINWLELLPPATNSGGFNGNNAYHVEAEDFISQNGTLLENCQDVGGTYDIASIDVGDWLDYRVNMPVGGNYQLKVRVSCFYSGTVQLLSATGTVLATLNVSNTGGYQSFNTFTTNVSLPAGAQTLRLAVIGGGNMSINWLELAAQTNAPPLDNYALTLNNNFNYTGGMIYEAENTFTVEFMVKPKVAHEIDIESTSGFSGTEGQKYVMFPVQGGSAEDSRAGMGVSVGTNGISVYEHADGYMPALLVWEYPIDTVWTHVAVVYHNGKPSLYINGVWKKDGLQSLKQHVYPGTMFPGGYYGSQGDGLLDEVRIWNVARTEAQIAANKDGELTGPQTGLVGYWPMNEGTGLMLHDVSGSGRDVDLTSAGYTSASWTNGRYSVASIIGNYRYAFNGKELDQDIGEDDYDYGMRIHDARLGRFLSVDPLTSKYPSWSSYPFAMNSPIAGVDLDGLEFLRSDEARVEIVNGIVKLKMSNMNWTTRRDFNNANEDPKNWALGEVGINTTIGSFSLTETAKNTPTQDASNLTDNQYGAPDPSFKPGQTKVERPAKSGLPDRRFKDRNVESATPSGSKALGIASIVIDGIILGNDLWTKYNANDDMNKVIAQAPKAAMALYDVNTALKQGLISPKFQTKEILSSIANYILSGTSTYQSKDMQEFKEIQTLQNTIYKTISTRRDPFIGPVKYLRGPSDQIIGTYRDANPNYDPTYGKDNNSQLQQNNKTPSSGG